MAADLNELTADMEYRRKNDFRQKFKEFIAAAAHRDIETVGYRNRENPEFRINLFAAGFINTVHTWLEHEDRTPRQIASFLHEMLTDLNVSRALTLSTNSFHV